VDNLHVQMIDSASFIYIVIVYKWWHHEEHLEHGSIEQVLCVKLVIQ
jgi:hypothetical protein